MKEKSENCKLKRYKDKKMKIAVYEKLDEESHRWLQCNIQPKKVVSFIIVQKQIAKSGTWNANRDLPVANDKCRTCRQAKKTVINRLSTCTRLFSIETRIKYSLFLITHPSEVNVNARYAKKLQKYKQLAFKVRARRTVCLQCNDNPNCR